MKLDTFNLEKKSHMRNYQAIISFLEIKEVAQKWVKAFESCQVANTFVNLK